MERYSTKGTLQGSVCLGADGGVDRVGTRGSAAIAETCEDAGIRLLVVRAVSDRASMRIPRCALAGVDADGELALTRFLSGLALAPGDLPAVLRLARGFRQACATLSTLARRSGPHFQLPAPRASWARTGGSQA